MIAAERGMVEPQQSEPKKRIVSDERMEELKEQLKENLNVQPMKPIKRKKKQSNAIELSLF